MRLVAYAALLAALGVDALAFLRLLTLMRQYWPHYSTGAIQGLAMCALVLVAIGVAAVWIERGGQRA